MISKNGKFIGRAGINSAAVYILTFGLVCLAGLLGIRAFLLPRAASGASG